MAPVAASALQRATTPETTIGARPLQAASGVPPTIPTTPRSCGCAARTASPSGASVIVTTSPPRTVPATLNGEVLGGKPGAAGSSPLRRSPSGSGLDDGARAA